MSAWRFGEAFVRPDDEMAHLVEPIVEEFFHRMMPISEFRHHAAEQLARLPLRTRP